MGVRNVNQLGVFHPRPHPSGKHLGTDGGLGAARRNVHDQVVLLRLIPKDPFRSNLKLFAEQLDVPVEDRSFLDDGPPKLPDKLEE